MVVRVLEFSYNKGYHQNICTYILYTLMMTIYGTNYSFIMNAKSNFPCLLYYELKCFDKL